MPHRLFPLVGLLALLGIVVAITPAAAETIHRNGFAGRDTFWVKADANIKFEETGHRISDEHCKNAPTSEYIKIESNPPGGSTDAEFIHYAYDTPPAPVSDRLTAGVWVKAYRSGIQIKARLVLPKEKDPQQPDVPLTTILIGDSYRNVRQWQPLSLGNVQELVRKHLPVLHARLGRAVDPTDAYIDRIMLNVYAGPGVTDVWVDDLEIGPVAAEAVGPRIKTPAKTVSLPDQPFSRGRAVEFRNGQIQVAGDDGKMQPFFMLAVRHTDTPLKTLRDAMFNTIWFPGETGNETLEDAIRQGFWLVPTVPSLSVGWDGANAVKTEPTSAERDADNLAKYLRRFQSGDAVLMWDLGGGRTAEEVHRVERLASVIRTIDPRRPRAVDAWDGYQKYSFYVDAVGTHRWPLFTSMELASYKDWLAQRRALTPANSLSWTWVQTHMPDWYVSLIAGRPDVDHFDEPVGPHPEQIRILTYLSLAAGCRGLGYWSDRFLANSHHGRDRLLELALLNSEIEMLKPVLLSAQEPAKWIPTSNANVQAAIIRGPEEVLVLPVWLGSGTQYVPPQGALPSLTVRVPLVPDGAIPWQVTAAGINELKSVRRVAGGTEITIPEFDLTAAIVFTSDLKLDGKIVRWQDHTRYRVGELAAKWAHQQAVEQFNKTVITHQRIGQAGGPDIREADSLLTLSKKSIATTREFIDSRQWDAAYREARRAQRPLRVLMREQWTRAVQTLDVPTASPYAVSFYSLPQHWTLAQEVQASHPAGTALPHGQFELSQAAPAEGAAVSSLPGWSTRQSTLDKVDALAAVVNSNKLEDAPTNPQIRVPSRYGNGRVAFRPEEFDQKPAPELGKHCLKLSILPKAELDKNRKPLPPPQALERAFLAVDSPVVDLAPGQLVRVSFWAKTGGNIDSSADGAVIYDSVGGEPLGVRLTTVNAWKQFHLYRRVPPNGKMSMTFALTGLGAIFFDDVRIEPLVGGTPKEPVARGQRK